MNLLRRLIEWSYDKNKPTLFDITRSSAVKDIQIYTGLIFKEPKLIRELSNLK